MVKPILDPSIPYIGPIYGGKFSPGKMIRVQGIAPGTAYWFNINLQCGPETSPRDDVAIQISVRLLDDYISINSLQNGIWGEEQRGLLSINRSEKFEIILMCAFNQYKVAINGQHYCEFSQRLHYDRISHLAIDGDVSIIQICYESPPGGATAGSSGSGLGIVTQASAPILVPSMENEADGFEMIDTATPRAPPPRLHSPSDRFSQPPPYDVAMNTVPAGAAYPTNAPYPTKYPTGMPDPTSAPRVLGSSPFQPIGAPRMFPPPAGAPVPLNAYSSVYRPVKRTTPKLWITAAALFFGIFVISLIIVVQVTKALARQ